MPERQGNRGRAGSPPDKREAYAQQVRRIHPSRRLSKRFERPWLDDQATPALKRRGLRGPAIESLPCLRLDRAEATLALQIAGAGGC